MLVTIDGKRVSVSGLAEANRRRRSAELKAIRALPVNPPRYGKVPASLKRYAAVIADVDRNSEGWVFGLINGWICTNSETHQVMRSTLAECAIEFQSVERCYGDCCKVKNGNQPCTTYLSGFTDWPRD